jgi:hypothetical protein
MTTRQNESAVHGRIDAEPPGDYPAVEFLDIPPMDAALARPPKSDAPSRDRPSVS